MKIAAAVIASLVLVIGAGCALRRPVPFSIIKDSSSTTVTYKVRDTVIAVPADSATVQVVVSGVAKLLKIRATEPGKTDDKSLPKVVMSRSGRSSVTLAAMGDTLTATANCDYWIEKIKLQDQTIKYMNTHREVITKEVPVRYMPWWAKVLNVLGGVALLLIILRIVLQFIKLPI